MSLGLCLHQCIVSLHTSRISAIQAGHFNTLVIKLHLFQKHNNIPNIGKRNKFSFHFLSIYDLDQICAGMTFTQVLDAVMKISLLPSAKTKSLTELLIITAGTLEKHDRLVDNFFTVKICHIEDDTIKAVFM